MSEESKYTNRLIVKLLLDDADGSISVLHDFLNACLKGTSLICRTIDCGIWNGEFGKEINIQFELQRGEDGPKQMNDMSFVTAELAEYDVSLLSLIVDELRTAVRVYNQAHPIPIPPAPPVDRSQRTTIDGTPEDEAIKLKNDGQQVDYVILTAEERAKGFVRPVRHSYVHVGRPAPKYPLLDLTDEQKERYAEKYGYVKFEQYPADSPTLGMYWTQAKIDSIGKGCGTRTTMSTPLAETYARDPSFYGATFCCGCGKHLPVGEHGEFVWDGTDERVGT